MSFPKMKYRPNEAGDWYDSVTIADEAEEALLGPDWCDSPLEWGLETAPGATPAIPEPETEKPTKKGKR